MIALKCNLHNYLKFRKIIMSNEVCKHNQIIAKKLKMQLVATHGEHPKKKSLLLSMKGVIGPKSAPMACCPKNPNN